MTTTKKTSKSTNVPKKQFTDTSALSVFKPTQTKMQEFVDSIYIDKELKEFITPLSLEESDRLEKSILIDGVRDSLIFWKTKKGHAVVDGHNRFTFIEKHSIKDFPYIIKEFAGIEEVKIYMINIQLGRRNISDQYKTYLRGMKVELNKVKGGNQYNTSVNVLKKIAEEDGVSKATVARASIVYKNVNAISEFVGKQDVDDTLGYKSNLFKDKKNTFKDIQEMTTKLEQLRDTNEIEMIEKARIGVKEAENTKQAVTFLKQLLPTPTPIEIVEENTETIETSDIEYQFYDKLKTLKSFKERNMKRSDKRVQTILNEMRAITNHLEGLFVV